MLDDVAMAVPPEAWEVDDIWLSGSLERRGIRIWPETAVPLADRTPTERIAPLRDAVFDHRRRADSDLRAIRYMQTTFGIWGGAGKV